MSTRVAQLADVARALAAAHRRGLVHRDVKPENVMVRTDGVVKVLDFGIARRAGGGADPHGDTQTPALPTLTVEGVKLGTPVYMAPEQIRGDVLDGRTDQFAVAAEVGVDPESLREASRALRAGKEAQGAAAVDVARRDAWLRQQRMLFFRHAGIYVIVNLALWVLGLAILTFTP